MQPVVLSKSDRSPFDQIDEELQSLHIADRHRSAIMADVRAKTAEALARSEQGEIAVNVALARKIHKWRLKANDAMGARILCDPKFEMLLELFVTHHEHKNLCVGDLCLSAKRAADDGPEAYREAGGAGFRCAFRRSVRRTTLVGRSDRPRARRDRGLDERFAPNRMSTEP